MPSDGHPSQPPNNPPRPARAPAKPAAGGIDPWALLAALRRHWLLAAVLSVLAGGGAAAAVWFLLPPGNHTVARVLHIGATQPGVAFGPQDQRSDFNTFKQTQVALLRSRQVLNAALRAPKVADSDWIKQVEDPLEWLEKELKVTFPASPELMHIELAGKADQMPILTALVDAIADAYLSVVVEKDHQFTLKKLEQLREFAARYDKKVKAIRLSMKKLREQAGTGNAETLALKQKLATREYEQALNELTRHRAEIRALKQQIEQEASGVVENEEAILKAEAEDALDKDDALAKMRAAAKKLKDHIDKEAGKTDLGLKARFLQPLLAQWEEQKDEIRQREAALLKTEVARLRKERKRTGATGITAKQRLGFLEEMEKLLVKDCERLNRESKQITLNTLDLEDFNYDLNEADGMRATLAKKAEVLAIETEAPPRIYRLDQDAVVVAPNEKMRKLRFCAMAAAAAVGLVLAGIALLELRTQRVTSPAEVAKSLGLAVVGVLPFYKANKGGPRAARRLKESVDDARTMLLHQADTGRLKVVMVTSAVPAEGKTSLSCHLAASLSRAGRRTLLIDADLRKPDAHNIFGKANAPGLCEVFRGETALSEAVQGVGLPGLRLLPAGRWDDRALRAVAQGGFGSVLAQLRQEYDFIVIDTSPVLDVPDALMLGKHVDGVLFAVMQGESRTHRLASAAGRFARLDAPILGMVVNGAHDPDQSAYGPYAYPLSAPSPLPAPEKKGEGRSW